MLQTAVAIAGILGTGGYLTSAGIRVHCGQLLLGLMDGLIAAGFLFICVQLIAEIARG